MDLGNLSIGFVIFYASSRLTLQSGNTTGKGFLFKVWAQNNIKKIEIHL